MDEFPVDGTESWRAGALCKESEKPSDGSR